jgi:hypothetical protein
MAMDLADGLARGRRAQFKVDRMARREVEMNWPSVAVIIRSASSNGRRKNLPAMPFQNGLSSRSSNQPRSSAMIVGANRPALAPISA